MWTSTVRSVTKGASFQMRSIRSLAAEDAGGIGGERRKDVEFGARQRNGMGADDYLFGVEIYRDVAEDEPAFALSGAGRLSCTAFEHCF